MRDHHDEEQRTATLTSPEDAQKPTDKRRRQRFDAAAADEDNPLICRGLD